MASPQFVAVSGTVVTSAGNGPKSVDKPTGTAEDDLLLLFWFKHYTGGGSSTLSVPSGFTLYDSVAQTSSEHGWSIYSKIAGASEPSTYTVEQTTNSAGNDRVWIATFRDVDTADPFDAAGSKTAGGSPVTTHTMAEVTAGTANATLIALAQERLGNARNFTAPSGMTDVKVTGGVGNDHTVAYLELSASGSTGTKSFASDYNTYSNTFGFTIKAAGGGGGSGAGAAAHYFSQQ